MALEQLLARQRWTEIRVVLTNEVQNVARVDRRQPPVTLLATFTGNQSGSALPTESCHQSLHLPIA
jgi:hypothetical protein